MRDNHLYRIVDFRGAYESPWSIKRKTRDYALMPASMTTEFIDAGNRLGDPLTYAALGVFCDLISVHHMRQGKLRTGVINPFCSAHPVPITSSAVNIALEAGLIVPAEPGADLITVEDQSNKAKAKTPAEILNLTAAQVVEYAASIGYQIDGAAFIDHYTASGWKRGNTLIKDWKACVRTWKARDNNKRPAKTGQGYENMREMI
jgi:hypothetical protein